ncbi:class II aldolase/adducin family protein [Pseudomonas sp. NPDC087598]|uniref:class II aldolase/adducin family protein n=1 Tax=Pseudomonas sp. NPDC087598 TaxID=3364440 RepID=UPI0038039CAD
MSTANAIHRPGVYDLPRDGHTVFRWEHPPQHESVEQERLQRKQSLAIAFRVFALQGFDMGGAGHITVRDPGRPDHFWVNPVGVYFGHLRVSDLLLVNPDGEILEGEGALNLAAFAIHAALHEARPQVIAAAHAHSLYGKAWSSLGRLLDPLTQDACAFYEKHALFDNFSGVVLDTSEGARIAQTLGEHNALILQNHGLLTVGQTVEAAAWRFIAMDNAARTQLLVEAAGSPRLIPHDVARHTARQVGTEFGGWFSFQPFRERILRAEPDVLT